jgi:hypothetical protein
MNMVIKGRQVKWSGPDYEIIDADVRVEASRAAGVWLVDNGSGCTNDDSPFRMIVGAATEEDAARAYVKHRKAGGNVPSGVLRVFPLASLEPIAMSGVVDYEGDEEWSAFQDAWVEVRL